ncbi:MAG: dihydrodipicolinate synthase family protein [Bacteroidota bacterium]|nr:dihydrodipicolinate synthase family protein [Bacteroidota bacterium]
MSKTVKKYSGVIVPMITPFNQDLTVDLKANERILDSFIKANVFPFLAGTTGESVSISDSQKALLIKSAVDHVNHRTLVYVGIAGNCLHDSIDNAKLYADMGADVLVAHLPFYYPINSDQMIRYFEQLAENCPCPLILYNIPVTTKQSIPVDVIEKLSYHPNIVGIKDSERGIERLDQSLALWKDRKDFVHLMGAAVQSAYALLNGSDGIVPSTGNITPKLYNDLYEAALRGDSQKAEELQELTNKISEVYQKNKILSQSIPALKVMMSVYGICDPYVMPPMYRLGDQEEERIKKETKQLLG